MVDLNEEGITNLGTIPPHMTFAEATEQAKAQRKFFINPYAGGHRLSLCDTLRMMWRETDKMEKGPQEKQLKEYLAQAFDMGKRMDARIKELKSLLPK